MKVKVVLLAELIIEDESSPLMDQADIEAEVSRRLNYLFDTTKTGQTIRIDVRRPAVEELDTFVANEATWLVDD